MKSGRYFSSVATIPAPETPKMINNGGSQQQLDAIIADSTVPILATSSPRPESGRAARNGVDKPSIAPGNRVGFVPQQSLEER